MSIGVTLSSADNFIDAVCFNPICFVDLTSVDIGNRDSVEVEAIRRSIRDDRIYRFTMSTNSPMFDSARNLIAWSSSGNPSGVPVPVWNSSDNVVEVYKLPPGLRWPTMYCSKQPLEDYVFPEFIIRRMDVLHRHRVNATMNRLWYRPDGDNSSSDTRIVWAGSPGCGKTVAVNEIVLDCILKLHNLGLAENQAKLWQFFIRNGLSLSKYYYDVNSNRVSHKLYSFPNSNSLLIYLRDFYKNNKNSFVIFEMDENEVLCPYIEMPFLLSLSCRGLDQSIKWILKSPHVIYLYNPMVEFEFKFFLDVCFAFCDIKDEKEKKTQKENDLSFKDEYLHRFHAQGGILRKIFANSFIDPVTIVFKDGVSSKSEALTALAKCSPTDLNTTVNLLVGAEFNFSTSFEDANYRDFRDFSYKLGSGSRFFPPASILYEYLHMTVNWRINILSDHIALSVGNYVTFPVDLISQSSNALFQIQERTCLYGGILRKPNIVYKMPNNFYMASWTFYECNPDVFENATKLQKKKKKLRVHTSIYYAQAIKDEERTSLIEKLPMTSSICYFSVQYLKRSFQELSSTYVYTCDMHNGPVFDYLTVDPLQKQLFLFQATLLDPQKHPVKISAFIEFLSSLHLNMATSIDAIYFFMIISAHDTLGSQHFFSFELAGLKLNACYLQTYSSVAGLSALKKVVILNPGCERYSVSMMADDEIRNLNKEELAILRTIGGCFQDKKIHKTVLPSALYQDLFGFLGFSSKIKPYICRAAFLGTNVSGA